MRICIDPGHGQSNATPGQFDPGAVYGGSREADITLEYGLALRDAILDRRWTPVMTRSSNLANCPLAGRVLRATNASCDVLISLHCNAADSETANGTETLFNTSQAFATRMQAAVVGALGLRDRGVKQRPGLAVLKFNGPCALIELGFLSNPFDRSVLLAAGAREHVAEQVCHALAAWH